MSDTHNRRLLRVQAQIEVLGAGETGPTRQEGERNLGPQRRANTAASTRLATRNGSWPNEQPSPFPHGRRPMDADEGNGSVQSVSAPAHGWWHQGNGQRLKAGKVLLSRGPSHKPLARRGVMARLADRVVVAMMPMDNITSAEQRTRGAALCATTRRRTRHGRPVVGTTGDPRRVAKSRTKGASNSGQPVPGQGADGIVRLRCLEAVLGKTRRTEF